MSLPSLTRLDKRNTRDDEDDVPTDTLHLSELFKLALWNSPPPFLDFPRPRGLNYRELPQEYAPAEPTTFPVGDLNVTIESTMFFTRLRSIESPMIRMEVQDKLVKLSPLDTEGFAEKQPSISRYMNTSMHNSLRFMTKETGFILNSVAYQNEDRSFLVEISKDKLLFKTEMRKIMVDGQSVYIDCVNNEEYTILFARHPKDRLFSIPVHIRHTKDSSATGWTVAYDNSLQQMEGGEQSTLKIKDHEEFSNIVDTMNTELRSDNSRHGRFSYLIPLDDSRITHINQFADRVASTYYGQIGGMYAVQWTEHMSLFDLTAAADSHTKKVRDQSGLGGELNQPEKQDIEEFVVAWLSYLVSMLEFLLMFSFGALPLAMYNVYEDRLKRLDFLERDRMGRNEAVHAAVEHFIEPQIPMRAQPGSWLEPALQRVISLKVFQEVHKTIREKFNVFLENRKTLDSEYEWNKWQKNGCTSDSGCILMADKKPWGQKNEEFIQGLEECTFVQLNSGYCFSMSDLVDFIWHYDPHGGSPSLMNVNPLTREPYTAHEKILIGFMYALTPLDAIVGEDGSLVSMQPTNTYCKWPPKHLCVPPPFGWPSLDDWPNPVSSKAEYDMLPYTVYDGHESACVIATDKILGGAFNSVTQAFYPQE